MQYDTEARLAKKLLEVFSRQVTIVEAKVGAVEAGRSTRFSFTNPVSRRVESAEGEAFESITPGTAVAVFLAEEDRWMLLSPTRFEQGNASTDQLLRRRPDEVQDGSRLPMVVSTVEGAEVKFGLIDGVYWTPLAAIPKQINGCPPNDDPDAPPLPAGPDYPGYFIYYFVAHHVAGPGSNEVILQVISTPGMPQPGANFRPYWGNLGFGPFQEPLIGDLAPLDNQRVAMFTGSLLASTVIGIYGVSYPDYTRFDVVHDALKNAGARIDLSTWRMYYRYDAPPGAFPPFTPIEFYGFEVVISLVKGDLQPDGSYLPPATPPPPPSGPKTRVLPGFFSSGSPLYEDAVVVDDPLDGPHGWERRNRKPNPPPPPDGSDPNRPPDGEPDYPLRDNPYQVLVTADRASSYVLLRHSPNCEEPADYQHHEVFKITNGEVSAGPLNPEDWRGGYLNIPQPEPIGTFNLCVYNALFDPKVNLLGPRTYEIQFNPDDPEGLIAKGELQKLITGGVANLKVETFFFDPSQGVFLCDRRSTSVKPVTIKAPGIPQPVQQFSPKIEAYAPIVWRT
jgi:hypothetical protein